MVVVARLLAAVGSRRPRDLVWVGRIRVQIGV
jgi:hypothetical protein